MKTSAELLGVSYGTLYGRYRETFGYLKGGWNNGSAARSPKSVPATPTLLPTILSSVVTNNVEEGFARQHEGLLEELKAGKITGEQACAAVGRESSALLAYQLALKVNQPSLISRFMMHWFFFFVFFRLQVNKTYFA